MNVFGEKTVSQIESAIAVLRRHGKLVGLAGGMDEESIKRWSALDIDILFAGADWNFVYAAAKDTLERLNAYHKQ